MPGTVTLDFEDTIAVIEISNPPVNALSRAVRSGLMDCFDAVGKNPDVKAIVVHGAGRDFIAGADIREFDLPPMEPHLPDVIDRIEASAKPVIAALAGSVLGGGFEVALGAHYRIALASAKFGLPEVTLGLIPGAGGTQRLPRLVGTDAALEIAATAKPISAEKAISLGVIDQLSDAPDARSAGIAFARSILAEGRGPRPLSARSVAPISRDRLDLWRAKLVKSSHGQIAPLKCLDAVAASSKPFAEGAAVERGIFIDLRESEQRAALSHVFFAERAAAKLPELEGTIARQVTKIGVVGGGTMGAGIAASCVLNGFEVTLVERDADAADRAFESVSKILTGSLERGLLTQNGFDAALACFWAGSDYGALSNADLVIEAVFESMDLKAAVFSALDAVCQPGCILASNTSYLDLNRIAALTRQPQNVIGLHFFSPAHIMKLLEIVVADTTAPEVVATGFALARRLGKIGVRSGVCDGFIGNRILMRYRLAADAAVLAGASLYEVDAAMVEFGFPMGPYAVGDLAGLDIAWAARKRRADTRHPNELVAGWLDTLCVSGRFGRKTGRGYYIYDDSSQAGRQDPELLEMIAAERRARGIAPRTLPSHEIADRCVFAIVNEACNILDEGIAQRPLDIDLTLLHGYGFPRWRGGPMHFADTTGLKTVLERIWSLQKEDSWFWQPAPLLERLVTDGNSFSDLNV